MFYVRVELYSENTVWKKTQKLLICFISMTYPTQYCNSNNRYEAETHLPHLMLIKQIKALHIYSQNISSFLQCPNMTGSIINLKRSSCTYLYLNSKGNIFHGLFDTVYGNYLKFFYLGPYYSHMIF